LKFWRFARFWASQALIGGALLLSACLPATPVVPTITPTQMPSPSPSATATVIWFPPTATFTPLPTREVLPTEDMHPAVAEVMLEDDFSDKTLWETVRTEVGSAAYGQNELTLAVSAPNEYLVSFRSEPQLSDYYLEIDIQPSLCRQGDLYGLLLRAESRQDFYRLMISCSGEMRLERVIAGRYLVLQDWIPTGKIFPGLKFRVGVWVANDELRVFVNNQYQFLVRDTVFASGQVGVFARAAGNTPLTVNFSNMVIHNINTGGIPTAIPTVTVTSTPANTRMPTATPH